jgi:hypothetical protein
MLYLDFAVNEEDVLTTFEQKLPYILRKFLITLKKKCGQVRKEKFLGKEIVTIFNTNKYTLKKLSKVFKVDVTKNVCICDELEKDTNFLEFLKEKNLNIIDGRWFLKFVLFDIINYICKQTGKKIETLEISILTLENNQLILQTVKKISKSVKNINIITKKPEKFKKLSEELFKEEGLILNVTNNMKKAVLNSNIIFNLNLGEEDFNKIKFPVNAVVVNFEKKISINQKSFNGINANFLIINLPIKYKKFYDRLNRFNSTKLYESLIYKKTSVENILNEIKNDNIEILALEGKNGRIRFKEFCDK